MIDESLDPVARPAPRVHRGQTAEALAHLEKIVVDGLRHGFFDYSITCQIVSGGKRQLMIRAGKCHKFTIRVDEVPR